MNEPKRVGPVSKNEKMEIRSTFSRNECVVSTALHHGRSESTVRKILGLDQIPKKRRGRKVRQKPGGSVKVVTTTLVDTEVSLPESEVRIALQLPAKISQKDLLVLVQHLMDQYPDERTSAASLEQLLLSQQEPWVVVQPTQPKAISTGFTVNVQDLEDDLFRNRRDDE